VLVVISDYAISSVLTTFWNMSKNFLTLFTRPFLARRRAWAGHEARLEVHRDQFEQFEPFYWPLHITLSIWWLHTTPLH